MKFDRLLNHDDLTEIQYEHFQNSLEFHKIIKARKFLIIFGPLRLINNPGINN